MRPDPRRRPFLTILTAGLAILLLVLLGGWIAERARLGAADDEAVARVEAEVRRRFARVSASLHEAAAVLAEAARPVLVRPADERDLRGLFERADALTARAGAPPLAVTVYATDGRPLAWSGRSAQVPPDRLHAAPALFVARGPGGLRLVSTAPVLSEAGAASPFGIVAAEGLLTAPLESSIQVGPPMVMATSVGPVELRLAGEAVPPRPESARHVFVVRGDGGEALVEASVDLERLAAARRGHRRMVADLGLLVIAGTLLLLAGPLLDRRAHARSARRYCRLTLAVGALLVAARAFVWGLSGSAGSEVFLPEVYRSDWLASWFRHPADFLANALLTLGLVALVAGSVDRWRAGRRGRRPALLAGRPTLGFLGTHLLAGTALAASVVLYEHVLADTFASSDADLLYFSPHPWNTARLALSAGLVLFHAALAWAVVRALDVALGAWRLSPPAARWVGWLALAWGIPILVFWRWWPGGESLPRVGGIVAAAGLAALAWWAPGLLRRLRHRSQGYRLVAMFLALLLPSVLMYPSLVFYEDLAKRRLTETRFAPEVLNQRENLQRRLQAAQEEIDSREELLRSVVAAPAPPPGASAPPENAFQVWQGTALERFRVSSAIELYNASQWLVSRFALNLPEDASRQRWREEGCTWRIFGESSPFGAQERQLLHAGRNVCGPEGVLGTIVIHVILDDSALSFLSSQDPYFELLRGAPGESGDARPEYEIEYAVYGWSRAPIYLSADRAWAIDDQTFERIAASRQPFWTRVETRDGPHRVYFGNDRRAIYALGYPLVTPIGHLINLAELGTLVGLVYALLLLGGRLFRVMGLRRPTSGRGLWREVRESFYRKLFLAFVAASIIPVVTLALVTRVYIADQLRRDVEAAAHNTTAIARQMIEELSAVRGETSAMAALNDDALVALSRVVGQDVNVYIGPQLLATSERDLFASGLLPARTPGDVYRAILLDRLPTVITEEQAGDFRFMIAGAPVRAVGPEAVLTVPLALRQREIEREIDELNRRIVLAAILFILVGAGFGYPLAERIADPVSRLTRATRRLSRGELDVRIATTASDELRRLVEAFNVMSAELQRQRVELERTHRLEAWAEMARQVAHEIKNPLTPIQLSAEHLRRVHGDRGRPMEPVLDGCVDTILSQVRLLRQIASEFSSFASSPTARVAPTSLSDLVEEVVGAYRSGAGDRIAFRVDVPDALPPLQIDRTLVGRALTNVVDNALHAMPGGGALTITARRAGPGVEVEVEDTGVGMDEDALGHLFEPYFSTKAVGTGLGLAIARRNVELNGGAIGVTSERGVGTRVTITLPVEGPEGRRPAGSPPGAARPGDSGDGRG
ncbi:MAG TPA: HAMP domain-containing sensor histidine kinase [Vicinamibacterales bacterium]|nr:HAMP domain-containing sensor histidine kinase [Vicinamibacterales bacterium]